MRVAIDTLGADAAADVLVAGALDAVSSAGGNAGGTDEQRGRTLGAQPPTLIFFGNARAIEPLIGDTAHEVVDAPRAARVDDPLKASLRGAVPSSMRAAIAALADGRVDAVVSAGSTGSLLALSRYLLGTLPGVRRPAIIKTFGAETGRGFRMLDLGANIGVGAPQLHQFALMGAAAARAEGLAAPTVALLNIGSEVRKGPGPVRAAAARLHADERIRFAGYIEPDRLFAGSVDVVVVDGFAGNIALKAAEGALRMARYILRRELGSALDDAGVGAALDRVRGAYNPQLYNGARLLGLPGVVVKSHGAANRMGFRCAVAQALGALSQAMVAEVAAGV